MTTGRRNGVPSHTEALAVALANLTLTSADDAAKRLALHYAAGLDDGSLELPRVGKDYLAVLGSLGCTPASRAALTKGGAPGDRSDGGADELSRLRERHAAR